MNQNIQNLIDAWDARPRNSFGPFEDILTPENVEELTWVTRLLPMLARVITDLKAEASRLDHVPAPGVSIPSIDLLPAPAAAPSNHTLMEIPSTAGTDAGLGQTADIAGTSAASTATDAVESLKKAALRHGRQKRATKPPGAPQKERRKTAGNEPA